MKKILSIALIAALVATSAFAGFSGNAQVKFGYDTTSKAWGFANSTSTALSLELAAETAEKKGEGDIYAGIKATMNVIVDEKKTADGNGVQLSTPAAAGKLALGANLSVKEAYVTNGEWKVSILGAVGAPSYAKSFVTEDTTSKDAFGNTYTKSSADQTAIDKFSVKLGKVAGVTVTYADFTVGVGLTGTDNKVAYSAYVQTPNFEVADGVKVQAAAYSAKAQDSDEVGVGASAKTSVTVDKATVTAAVDAAGIPAAGRFGVDATVGVKYDFVAVDAYAYFQDDAKRVDAKAALDLNSFEVPVKLTVTGKDLTNDKAGQDISAKVEATVSKEVSCDATVGYVLSTKKISTSANVKYAAEMFTAKAGVAFSTTDKADTKVLSATASVETTKLVDGATLSLTYGKDPDSKDMNFLDKQATAKNYGAVTAACKIAF